MLRVVLLLLPVVCNSLNCHEERDRGYSCPEHPEVRKFYFDSKQNVCQPLFHRGCGGNSNQFEDAADCKAKCQGGSGKNSSHHPHKVDNTLVDSVNACNLKTDAKISSKVLKCGSGCPMGHICTEDDQCCPTKYHICTLPVESGHEREFIKHYGRYAYSPGLKNCIRFSYFGAEGNFNNFLNYQSCKDFCKNI